MGYTELTRKQVCPDRKVLAALSRHGVKYSFTTSALRAQCKCGRRLAIVESAGRPVSDDELDRIREHLIACNCTRGKH